MMDSNFLNSDFLSALNSSEDSEITQRLGLYQVFLRLYEQNRGLLDEVLSLETTGSQFVHVSTPPFIQGMVLDQQVFLVTNLVGHKTQALTQGQNIWTIGRDSRNVAIPIRDSRMSRVHAAIEYIEGEGFYLVDLGSSNGSYVNGECIRHHILLQEGDRVRLGSFTFTFFECDSLREMGRLSDVMLSKISIVDAPPTAPLAPSVEANTTASAKTDESADTARSILEDTSTYMFMPHRSTNDGN